MDGIEIMQFSDVANLANPCLISSLRKYEKLREALVDEAVSKYPGTRQEAHALLDDALSGNSYIVLPPNHSKDNTPADAVQSWWTGRTCAEYLAANGADNWSKREFATFLDVGVDELFKSSKAAA